MYDVGLFSQGREPDEYLLCLLPKKQMLGGVYPKTSSSVKRPHGQPAQELWKEEGKDAVSYLTLYHNMNVQCIIYYVVVLVVIILL